MAKDDNLGCGVTNRCFVLADLFQPGVLHGSGHLNKKPKLLGDVLGLCPGQIISKSILRVSPKVVCSPRGLEESWDVYGAAAVQAKKPGREHDGVFPRVGIKWQKPSGRKIHQGRHQRRMTAVVRKAAQSVSWGPGCGSSWKSLHELASALLLYS